MLITLLGIILIVDGIACLVSEWMHPSNTDALMTCKVACGILSIVLGICTVFVCVASIIEANVNVELQYRQDEIEYEILQEQVDSGDYKSATLISDIISYNQKVTDYKARYNSPWVGWFYYRDCEKLPFVEIPSKE